MGCLAHEQSINTVIYRLSFICTGISITPVPTKWFSNSPQKAVVLTTIGLRTSVRTHTHTHPHTRVIYVTTLQQTTSEVESAACYCNAGVTLAVSGRSGGVHLRSNPFPVQSSQTQLVAFRRRVWTSGTELITI